MSVVIEPVVVEPVHTGKSIRSAFQAMVPLQSQLDRGPMRRLRRPDGAVPLLRRLAALGLSKSSLVLPRALPLLRELAPAVHRRRVRPLPGADGGGGLLHRWDTRPAVGQRHERNGRPDTGGDREEFLSIR